MRVRLNRDVTPRSDLAVLSGKGLRPKLLCSRSDEMRVRDVVVRHVGLAAVLVVTLSGRTAAAQGVVGDPTGRLAAVLPASVAQHVLALVRTARAEGLPGDALANRSLKFAARGIAPADIARAADEQLTRMRTARDLLRGARPKPPSGGEIEAGAEALREGVSGSDVAALAKSTPGGRSLAVPLYVVGSLVSTGLSSNEALQRIQAKLASHASDTDIEAVGREAAASHRPANPGRGNGAGPGHSEGVSAPASAHGGGPPAGIPRNAGKHGRPTSPPGHAPKPPGHGKP